MKSNKPSVTKKAAKANYGKAITGTPPKTGYSVNGKKQPSFNFNLVVPDNISLDIENVKIIKTKTQLIIELPPLGQKNTEQVSGLSKVPPPPPPPGLSFTITVTKKLSRKNGSSF